MFLSGLGCGLARAAPPEQFQGTVEFEQLDLGFEFGGKLGSLWVRRGDRVEAGQALAALDDTLERAATRARASESEAARSRAALTKEGTRPEQIRALEARLRAASATIQRQRENLERERTLGALGVTPPATVDDLAAELDRSSAERDALAEELALLQRGPRRDEIAASERQADAFVALLDVQRQREARFELRAPLAGEVLDHLFEPGEVVGAGAPVVSMADTTRPLADVFVPQAEMGRVRLGAPVEVRVDAIEQPFGGRVEHVARELEFTPRYLFSERERPNLVLRVRVRIDDPERRLHAGLPARVRFAAPAMNAGRDDS